MTRSRALVLLLAAAAAVAAALAVGYRLGRATSGPAPIATESAVAVYHCPMHPTIVSDHPGSCPICQMKLVPRNDVDSTPSEAPGPVVPGLAPVRISAQKQQLIGATTEPVVLAPFVREIRTVGRVSVDETHLHHVHTKVPGWIEHFAAGAEGDIVRRGQPLLTIYSPELLATQQEYRIALANRERLAASGSAEAMRNADELLESTRKRLQLWDMSPPQIADLERTGQVVRTVTLHSPVSGTIVSRNVSHGERIESVTSLLDIADLSRVWVLADVYEYELPFVRAGQQAKIVLSFLPGRTFHGRVSLVSPMLSEKTRTVKARVVLENPDLALRPGMFADVTLESDLGVRLSLPNAAILRSGEREIVFVERGEGLFEPREVRIGLRLVDRVEVLEGVTAGERVLASANFFIDAESRLEAALSAASAQPHP